MSLASRHQESLLEQSPEISTDRIILGIHAESARTTLSWPSPNSKRYYNFHERFTSHHSRKLTLPREQKVYALLKQIPEGRVSSYAAMASALKSSPRAVGGALRRNPFAPEVVSAILRGLARWNRLDKILIAMQPCHRCIAANGYLGGFKGDWEKAPSGQNQTSKLALLSKEGVEFNDDGYLVDGGRWFVDFDV